MISRTRIKIIAGLLAASGVFAAAGTARADDDPRRDSSYYRGASAPADAGDAALWVPRVILSPLYAVTEFGVRRPLVAFADWVEANHVDVYTRRVFQPHPNFSWAPALTLDFALQPMYGATFTWNNFLGEHNQLYFHGLTGGEGYVDVTLRDRVTAGTLRLGVQGHYFDRPDRMFFGIGPNTQEGDLTRYRLLRRDVIGSLEWLPTVNFNLAISGGYRQEQIGEGITPSLDAMRFQSTGGAPGFGPLMDLMIATAQATADSRNSHLEYGGIRLELEGTYGLDLSDHTRQFLVGSAQLEAAVEVSHPGRTLVGSIYYADSLALGDQPVPFTYLPRLGRGLHPGFREGRFTGESAIVAEVDYRYPIWMYFDAVWLYSVGNVFGRNLAGFDPGALTSSIGFGIRTRGERIPAIEALIAVGSSRFNEPFMVDSLRLYLGVNRGL